MSQRIRLLTVLSVIFLLAAAVGLCRAAPEARERVERGTAAAFRAPELDDPTDRPSVPAPRGPRPASGARETIESRSVEFEPQSARLTAAGRDVLDEIVPRLREVAQATIRIEVTADAWGHWLFDQGLSHARAKAVRAHLVAAGIDESRLTAFGRGGSAGTSEPGVADGSAAEGVEFVLLGAGPGAGRPVPHPGLPSGPDAAEAGAAAADVAQDG